MTTDLEKSSRGNKDRRACGGGHESVVREWEVCFCERMTRVVRKGEGYGSYK